MFTKLWWRKSQYCFSLSFLILSVIYSFLNKIHIDFFWNKFTRWLALAIFFHYSTKYYFFRSLFDRLHILKFLFVLNVSRSLVLLVFNHIKARLIYWTRIVNKCSFFLSTENWRWNEFLRRLMEIPNKNPLRSNCPKPVILKNYSIYIFRVSNKYLVRFS